MAANLRTSARPACSCSLGFVSTKMKTPGNEWLAKAGRSRRSLTFRDIHIGRKSVSSQASCSQRQLSDERFLHADPPSPGLMCQYPLNLMQDASESFLNRLGAFPRAKVSQSNLAKFYKNLIPLTRVKYPDSRTVLSSGSPVQ